MDRRISRSAKRAVPSRTQLVSRGIPRRLLHAVSILLDEGRELLVRNGLLKNLRVPHNYTHELLDCGIIAADTFADYAVGVAEVIDHGGGD